MNNKLILVWLSFICAISSLYGIDNYHFYRASNFFGEPRFEKDLLTTFELSVAGGSTSQGINSCGAKVPLFDIWGLQDMRVLGAGVPDKDPTNSADLALINLALLPGNGCFAKLSFPGNFRIIETNLNLIQNMGAGFFWQLYLPVRRIESCPSAFIDLSSDFTCCPNKNSPEWQDFLNQFDNILVRYNLTFAGPNRTSLGDTNLLLGWTYNYQETEILDYVDTTVKIGMLFPTADPVNENLIFDIPFGYDHHYGFDFILDGSVGLYEWLTLGAHAGALVFLNRCQFKRIKTDPAQSGLIKLATAQVVSDEGPIWDLGTYIKADHLGNTASILFGYSFAAQERSRLCLCGNQLPLTFSNSIVNTDERLKGWSMHTFHFLLEIDFTKEDAIVGPRIGFLWNTVVGGKRVFDTGMIGGYFGVDIAWQF